MSRPSATELYWDRKPISYVAGLMFGWCDAAFSIHRDDEQAAVGFFLVEWVRWIGNNGALYCNQDCVDMVRRFVTVWYLDARFKRKLNLDMYIPIVEALMHYVHWKN